MSYKISFPRVRGTELVEALKETASRFGLPYEVTEKNYSFLRLKIVRGVEFRLKAGKILDTDIISPVIRPNGIYSSLNFYSLFGITGIDEKSLESTLKEAMRH